ncbi:NACHT domain-containing NTPase [Frankia sp. R82]|uniref:NACHT domain-containing protein n=1 Tax=Frankia sp. R82 TaxID=2950553 RepID=UPI002044337B|nr:hypothetical protein [Frankia sp. R82]MCM3882240.1 hypothetical protein [Frankia sp. R82]
MAGIDTVRGIAFQQAQALRDVVDLVVVDSDAETVLIEGADDVVDYEVRDGRGRRLAVRQAKTRQEPGTWGAAELARILCAWGEMDDADKAEFAFVTDASLNRSGRELRDLIQEMRERPDETALRQAAATIGPKGVQLPSLEVLRRVQILTRMGTTEHVLAQAEMRILTLLGRGRIATLDDAVNATNALFRRLFIIGGDTDLKRRTISRADVLTALGIEEASLQGGLAWSAETAVAYRAAMSDTGRQVRGFLPLDLVSVASTPTVLRLLHPQSRRSDVAEPSHVILGQARAVLVGAAGQGKTITLTHLGEVAAARGLLPVIVPAAGHVAGALPRRIRHAVEVQLGQSLTAGAVDALLSAPTLVLLIDGVSEVDSETRDALGGDLQRFAAQRSVQMIATGRDLSLTITVMTGPETPAAYQLTTLNRDARRRLARTHGYGDEVVSLIEHRLGDTVDNPMLFVMALSVSAGGVPDSRADVYGLFLRGLAARAGLGDDDIHIAAMGAAWAQLIGRGLRAADHYTWLSSLSAELDALRGLPVWRGHECSPADALSHAQAVGLLTRLDPDSGLAPLHDSFADYLAARAIARGQVALPAVLDPGYDETVLFTVDMAGLSDDLTYRLAAENPLLACRVARLPQASGLAEPSGVGRLVDALIGDSVLPLFGTSKGLSLYRHNRFTGVALAGEGRDLVDGTTFEVLSRDHPSMLVPKDTGNLQLAIALWAKAVRRAHRPHVRVFQPAPPADPDAATELLPKYLRAVEAELKRLVTSTLPAPVRQRVSAILGPQGMVAYVDDPEPGAFGGLDLPVRYRRDVTCVVTRADRESVDDSSMTAGSTLATLMRRHPTDQAAHELGQALAMLTDHTWPMS